MPDTPSYVRKILDISTAHISQVTSWYLDSWMSYAPMPAIVYPKGEYGWLVYVPSEPGQETNPVFPEDLRRVMEFARSLDCDWVMFDRDGVVIDDLPSWEW